MFCFFFGAQAKTQMAPITRNVLQKLISNEIFLQIYFYLFEFSVCMYCGSEQCVQTQTHTIYAPASQSVSQPAIRASECMCGEFVDTGTAKYSIARYTHRHHQNDADTHWHGEKNECAILFLFRDSNWKEKSQQFCLWIICICLVLSLIWHSLKGKKNANFFFNHTNMNIRWKIFQFTYFVLRMSRAYS